jgi:hypothetical protein
MVSHREQWDIIRGGVSGGEGECVEGTFMSNESRGLCEGLIG